MGFFRTGNFLKNKEKMEKHGIFENVLQSSGFFVKLGFLKSSIFCNEKTGFFSKTRAF